MSGIEMKNVYISCPVLTPEPITELQNQLSETTSFKPTPIDKLHSTLFYYGQPESIYNSVKQINNRITFPQFMEKFCSQLTPDYPCGEIVVRGEALDIFGEVNKPVFVIRFTSPEELIEVRNDVFKRFNQFLFNCGVNDTFEFMRGNSNFKHQLEYHPHITLGRSQKISQIPELKENIQLTLGKPQLVNIQPS